MDFHTFRDDFSTLRRFGLPEKNLDANTFYESMLKNIVQRMTDCDARGIPYARLEIEMLNRTQSLASWEEKGHPYIKLYPAVAGMLANTKIDIDCKHVQFPFPAFCVRFPKKDNPMVENPEWPLRSILVSSIPAIQGRYGSQMSGREKPTFASDRQVIMWFDFGEIIEVVPEYPEPVFFFLNLHLRDGTSVQESLEAAQNRGFTGSGYIPSPDFCSASLAIAVAATFFLNDKHYLVAPDIHRRYIERWKRAEKKNDEHEKKTVIEQSRKLDHYGWNVGRDVELPRPISLPTDVSGHGQEHCWKYRFSHIRSGHMRYQPYGPRENPTHKLIFIPPTQIRPDLPPKPMGFVIKDPVK